MRLVRRPRSGTYHGGLSDQRESQQGGLAPWFDCWYGGRLRRLAFVFQVEKGQSAGGSDEWNVGRQPEVAEDLPGHEGRLDQGDEPACAPTAHAGQDVHAEGSAEKLGPGQPPRQRGAGASGASGARPGGEARLDSPGWDRPCPGMATISGRQAADGARTPW